MVPGEAHRHRLRPVGDLTHRRSEPIQFHPGSTTVTVPRIVAVWPFRKPGRPVPPPEPGRPGGGRQGGCGCGWCLPRFPPGRCRRRRPPRRWSPPEVEVSLAPPRRPPGPGPGPPDSPGNTIGASWCIMTVPPGWRGIPSPVSSCRSVTPVAGRVSPARRSIPSSPRSSGPPGTAPERPSPPRSPSGHRHRRGGSAPGSYSGRLPLIDHRQRPLEEDRRHVRVPLREKPTQEAVRTPGAGGDRPESAADFRFPGGSQASSRRPPPAAASGQVTATVAWAGGPPAGAGPAGRSGNRFDGPGGISPGGQEAAPRRCSPSTCAMGRPARGQLSGPAPAPRPPLRILPAPGGRSPGSGGCWQPLQPGVVSRPARHPGGC